MTSHFWLTQLWIFFLHLKLVEKLFNYENLPLGSMKFLWFTFLGKLFGYLIYSDFIFGYFFCICKLSRFFFFFSGNLLLKLYLCRYYTILFESYWSWGYSILPRRHGLRVFIYLTHTPIWGMNFVYLLLPNSYWVMAWKFFKFQIVRTCIL